MKKPGIIIPYFGNWPPYLSLFLETCRLNPELTILFFTDLDPPTGHPENVRFYPCTMREIRTKMDEIVGFETAELSPYKLCDLRPAYGLLFREYLEDFDFWGWGDVDVLYGRLRHFDVFGLLDLYDVVSFRRNWVSGSFCMIRNDDRLNTLFLTSKDIKKVYSDPRHMCFDEISFCWNEARSKPINEIRFPYDNFTRIVVAAVVKGQLTAYFDDLLKESIPVSGHLEWNNGKITDQDGKEHLLYHFVTEKKRLYFKPPHWSLIPARFYVHRTGFYSEDKFRNRRLVGAVRVLRSIPATVRNFIQRAGNRFIK